MGEKVTVELTDYKPVLLRTLVERINKQRKEHG